MKAKPRQYEPSPTPSIAYEYYPGHVYLNISNRCTNACLFCSVRRNQGYLGGFNLNLAGAKTAPLRIHPAAPERACDVIPAAEGTNTGDDGNSSQIRNGAGESPNVPHQIHDPLKSILNAEPDPETIKTHLEPYCARKGEDTVREFVFCGAGEPLIRLDAVLVVSAWLKEQDFTVRVNTNGQARLLHGPSVVQRLSEVIDSISISLNAHEKELYNKVSRPSAPDEAFDSLIEFSQECAHSIPDVTLSVVSFNPADHSGSHPLLDLDACAELASSLGARFRIR